MPASFNPKPTIWAFDPAAVDPYWYDNFWKYCIACVPAWEININVTVGAPTPPRFIGGVRPNGFEVASYDLFRRSGGGDPAWDYMRDGPAFSFLSTNSWNILPGTDNTDLIGSTRVTYLFVRKRLNTNSQASAFGTEAINNPSRAGGTTPYIDGNVYWDFGGVGAPNRLTWSGYTITTNIEKWAFVAGTRGSAIYLDGLVKASQSTALTRTPGNNATNATIGLNLGEGVGGCDQMISFFAVLDTEWTAGQVAAWAEDPYAPLRMEIDIKAPTGAQIYSFNQASAHIGQRITNIGY